MLLHLVFLLSGFSLAVGNDCPAYNQTVTCTSSVLFVLDFTNVMSKNQTAKEISSVKDQILLHLASNAGQKVGITYTGGNGYPMPASLSSSYDELCAQIDAMSSVPVFGKPSSIEPLFEAIHAKFGNTIDHLILYTTSSDMYDFDFAGDYSENFMPNMKISIISMVALRALWSDFPYFGVIYVFPDDLYNQAISNCIVSQTCGSFDQCKGLDYQAAPTPTPPATTPNPAVLEQGCSSCNPRNVSADVVIMIENSAFTGQDGLQKIQNYIKNTFSQFNIQPSGSTDPFYVRLGIYYYSDKSYLYKTFGTVTSNDVANINIPFNNVNQTDMVDTLWKAEHDLERTVPQRTNAPGVVVVFATDFEAGPYRFPVADFHDFIGIGGRVIVYELDKPEKNNYVLHDLTNPVYYINSSQPNAENAMITAMCTATCICPAGTKPYVSDPNTAQPLAGCYSSSKVVMSYATASATCAKSGGYVAEAQTADKSTFLTTLSNSVSLYQGLKWDQFSSNWVWANGKPLGSDYAPWATSSAHSTNQDCVTIAGGKWRQTDCRNNFNYVCQLPPCDQKTAC